MVPSGISGFMATRFRQHLVGLAGRVGKNLLQPRPLNIHSLW